MSPGGGPPATTRGVGVPVRAGTCCAGGAAPRGAAAPVGAGGLPVAGIVGCVASAVADDGPGAGRPVLDAGFGGDLAPVCVAACRSKNALRAATPVNGGCGAAELAIDVDAAVVADVGACAGVDDSPRGPVSKLAVRRGGGLFLRTSPSCVRCGICVTPADAAGPWLTLGLGPVKPVNVTLPAVVTGPGLRDGGGFGAGPAG